MLSPLPRAKRGRNPREDGREAGDVAPAQAEAPNHARAKDRQPTDAASSGGQEFGNNAFANLEFKPRQ